MASAIAFANDGPSITHRLSCSRAPSCTPQSAASSTGIPRRRPDEPNPSSCTPEVVASLPTYTYADFRRSSRSDCMFHIDCLWPSRTAFPPQRFHQSFVNSPALRVRQQTVDSQHRSAMVQPFGPSVRLRERVLRFRSQFVGVHVHAPPFSIPNAIRDQVSRLRTSRQFAASQT